MGNNQPTQEQTKEFWERYIPERIEAGRVVEGLPNIPIDLNSLYKHAVPQLLEEYNIESYSFKQTSGLYYSETCIWRKGNTKHTFEVLHDELIAKDFQQGEDLEQVTALALFWALWQVKEEGK